MYISLDGAVFFSSLLLSSHVSLCEVALHLCIQFLRAGSKEGSVNRTRRLACTRLHKYVRIYFARVTFDTQLDVDGVSRLDCGNDDDGDERGSWWCERVQ